MSEPFLAEIKIVGFSFAPRSWAFCDGQILPINQNQSLYSLMGTTYGGDGQTTFALPDLRGRVPMHEGNGFSLGQKGGAENHTLSQAEMPAHSHVLHGTHALAGEDHPGGALPARSETAAYKTSGTGDAPMAAGSVSSHISGNQSHENMQPFLSVSFAIALQGLFPSS